MKREAVVVGISGCSSSGKTTLARILRDIFPHTFVLHEDDFYKPENQLPVKDGLADWDCAESISVPDMQRALAHILASGSLPPDLNSKEDRNSVGACPIQPEHIAAAKTKVDLWLQPGQPGARVFSSLGRVCILDGFLLYCLDKEGIASMMAQLDVKLFLLVSRARATQRREARDGYFTLEGFWKDPPGYMDKIVWPNYVDAHRWLFEGGDVEGGKVKEDAAREHGILIQMYKEVDVEFSTTLHWAVETLMRELELLAGVSK